MKLEVASFRGMVPRLAPQLLPDNAAQVATNARLLSGDLEAWRQFLAVKTLANAPKTIYLLNDKWLSWTTDVDVARGIIPGDNTYRIYLTGPDQYAQPRWTNYALATTGAEPFPVATYPLGVPNPDSVPTLAVGVDPSPTSFSTDVLDEGNNLTTNWTTSPVASAGTFYSEVTQDAVTGNPAPSYRLQFQDNLGVPTYLYRDFGVKDAAAVKMTVDFYMTDAGGQYQGRFRIANDAGGAGVAVQVGFPSGTGDGPFLAICLVPSWSSAGSIIQQVSVLPLTMSTWYTMEASLTKNADGTVTVTATLLLGSGQIGTITATVSPTSTGGFCGAQALVAQLGSVQSTYVDNFLVQASGSLGYVPTNLATSYVFTYVNSIGEESGPSLPSATITRPDGVSVTITTPTGLPTGVSTDYNITAKRIYRAATGNTGTVFRFVAELPLATANYVDVLTDAELGEVLASDNWDLPPDDLRGILALPNGVMVGFRRNQLCLSAQNHPHAWPLDYRLNVDTDIVGIANIDNTVVIGTKSFPYLAFGNDPAAYSMSKLEVPQACVAKRSFAYLVGIGVVFASPDGLIAIAGTGQVRNLTETVFTRHQWQDLVPETIIGVAHDDVYHFWYDRTSLVELVSGWDISASPGVLFITVSEADDVLATSLSQPSIKGVQGRSAGKKYFEIECVALTLANSWIAGMADATTPATNGAGDFSSATGKHFSIRFSGQLWSDAAFVGCGSGTTGDIVGVAIDFSGLTASIYLNNSLQGTYVVPAATAFFPFFQARAAGNNARLRTVTSQFTYTPPAGYSPWGQA